MLFNSWHFLIFFPIVVCVYFAIPAKVKYIWLLICSYYFYMCWNPAYVILIAASTFVTWSSGILLGTPAVRKEAARKKLVVAGSFVINLGILAFFKYFNFLLDNLNHLLGYLRMTLINNPFHILLPVGISFYTFQALGYTVDVYRGKIESEKNILKYALFVSFFPQLVAGPIERSGNLLNDIRSIPEKKLLDYDRITRGLILMLYGMFLKLVIADRAAVFTDMIFDQYSLLGGWGLAVGAAGFSLQIYCDFASYSTIAIGAAKVMGFSLMENFNTPYFAESIQDFWRRWHISLSTWFRDYLYIPLGGNRCSKLRRHFNLMVVFLVSGLWHGAGWHFVVWGGLHGFYQIAGDWLRPLRERIFSALGTGRQNKFKKVIRITVTMLLVAFAWIFFRSDSLTVALKYIARMFTAAQDPLLWKAMLEEAGFSRIEWLVLAFSVLILVFVSLIRYCKNETLDAYLSGSKLFLRWGFIYLLFFMTVIFGRYGLMYSQKAFIYFQF